VLPWLHGKLLNFLKPFLRWCSGKHAPWTHKGVTGKDYYAAQDILEPGDIFVTKIRGELTSLIIPGYWSHAAIYCPTAPGIVNEYIMEAEGPGVIRTDLVTFMMSKDELMVLRTKLPPQVCARAAVIATEQLGKPYDFDMVFHLSGQKAFYCSELVWWAYAQACMEFHMPCPFIPKKELGVLTISPDNIAVADFEKIYKSRGV
jgi:hypothetical protein